MNKLLKTLLPIDIAKGLALTGKRFLQVFLTANHREKQLHLVQEYPEVPVKVPERFRGRVQLLKDEQGEIKCVACMACAKACPTGCLTIEGGKKEGRKNRIPVRFEYELERCIFCGFCAEACNFGAITLNDQFELAAYDREDLCLGLEGRNHNLFEPSPVGRFSVLTRKPER